jgi:glucose-6-phosphate isomerase
MQEMQFGSKKFSPDVRRLFDMKEVLYDREWLKTAENADLYYMYRDLALSKKDYEIMHSHGIRYDITVVLPGALGKEFNKTAGHYHPLVDGTNLSYPEIYEVLEGEAHYLLQKLSAGDEVDDVVVVKAKRGYKVLIPPNYGHVTINPSKKVLRMANFIAKDFSSIYDPFKRKSGAAYFELTNGEFVRNENYADVKLRFADATMVLELKKSEEMYGLIRKDVSKLDFLVRPQNFPELWEKELK